MFTTLRFQQPCILKVSLDFKKLELDDLDKILVSLNR